jgi:hypothetical protein
LFEWNILRILSACDWLERPSAKWLTTFMEMSLFRVIFVDDAGLLSFAFGDRDFEAIRLL